MAKKTKTIEIKSVPTEPQRGAGQDASYDDPVGIYYPIGGISRLIGSLAGGDEDEAVIKTGGCIVEHDINVRYRAPASGITLIPFNLTFDTGVSLGDIVASIISDSSSVTGIFIKTDTENNIVYCKLSTIDSCYIVPSSEGLGGYFITVAIYDEDHSYNVLVNQETAEYDTTDTTHYIRFSNAFGGTIPTEINVFVSERQA